MDLFFVTTDHRPDPYDWDPYCQVGTDYGYSYRATFSLDSPAFAGHIQFNALWAPDYAELEDNASPLFDYVILAVAEIALREGDTV